MKISLYKLVPMVSFISLLLFAQTSWATISNLNPTCAREANSKAGPNDPKSNFASTFTIAYNDCINGTIFANSNDPFDNTMAQVVESDCSEIEITSKGVYCYETFSQNQTYLGWRKLSDEEDNGLGGSAAREGSGDCDPFNATVACDHEPKKQPAGGKGSSSEKQKTVAGDPGQEPQCTQASTDPLCTPAEKAKSCSGDQACAQTLSDECGNNDACRREVAENAGFGGDLEKAEAASRGADDFEEYYETAIEECKEQKTDATKCCNNHNSCIKGGAAIQGILQMVQQVQGAEGGISAQCEAAKNMAKTGAGLTGLGLAMCTSKKETCEDTCAEVRKQARETADYLKAQCGTPGMALIPNDAALCNRKVQKLETKYKTANRAKVACESLDEAQIVQGMQIAAFATAMKLSGDCEDAVTNQSTDFPEYADTGQMFSGDCSNPAFFNHPTCVACRENPSAAACNGVIGLNDENSEGDGGYNPDSSVASTDSSSFSKDLVGDINDDDLEVGDPNPIGSSEAKLAAAGGGPGGGGPPGSGGGLSALGTSKKGGNGKKGYNTDILKGARGGGGYVSKMGFRSGGGYSSGRGGGRRERKEKSFNLKDYLPGGKKYKGKERGLASAFGAAGTNAHPATVNIFERLSHRFHRQCKKGSFLSCGTTYWEMRRKQWKQGQKW